MRYLQGIATTCFAYLRRAPLLLACVFFLSGCEISGVKGSNKKDPADTVRGLTKRNVNVSWTPNREVLVNSAGGGYKVYYSTTSNFSISSASFVEVSHQAATGTPNSVVIPELEPGKYYFKIVAYSALNPTGSATSTQFSVTVPVP